jgi:pimeloyl-ACP methyl ester carboxylesterase
MNINGCYVNYIEYGKGTDTIVLLHGWGQNIAMMKSLGDAFQNKFRIIIPDLPGYGLSSEPNEVWTIMDYAECIHTLLENLHVKSPILMGHSFGGKISLYYASKYEVKKLVLFASPFKKEIKKESIKLKILKSLKKVPLLNKLENFAKKHIGSTDYKNATPKMREILVSTVNLDLTEDVKKIKCPTLIFWGTNDTAVPVKRAYELESLIKDSGTVIYEGTHYTYLEYLPQVVNVLYTFLK